MPNRTWAEFAVCILLLLSMTGRVYGTPGVIWSWPLPSGLSVDTGTLTPDQTFVMSNGVIAIGSAPCPNTPWLCTKTEIYPSAQTFWALDASTGKVKWTTPLPNGSVIRPVAASQKLIFAAYTNPNQLSSSALFKTLALDIQTGHVVWSIPRPNWNGDPLLAGSTIITPDEMNPRNWTNPDPTLTSYDSFTGGLRWRIHTAPVINYPAAFGGGIIFAEGGPAESYQTKTLTAYDVASGAQIWSKIVLSNGCPSYMNGALFVTQSFDAQATRLNLNLAALNASNGETLWNETIGHIWSGDWAACPIVGENHLFAITYPAAYPALPELLAINPVNGHEIWRRAFPCEQDPLDPTMCRQVLWSNEAFSSTMVFVAAGFLYGVDAGSGNIAWSYGFTADNWNPLGYQNGVLYALNRPNGLAPNLVALSLGQAVPEMSGSFASVTVLMVTLTLLSIHVLKRRSGASHARRH